VRRFPQKGSAFLAGLAVIVLSGCTVGPKYSRPQVPTTPTFRGPDESAVSGTNTPSLGDERWSEVFKEPELQELIRTAIKNNYDLAVAAQRVLEQQAQVRITRSQQFPTLNVGGTGVGAELPASLGSAIDSPIVAGSFNLQAAWTPDFWGLYRRQTEAARAVLLQQKWAQRAVQLSVVQQTAATYFQLRALDRQLEIAKQTLKIRQNSVELTRKLQQGGSAPLSDVRQAEQLLYTASAQIPQIEQQIQQAENSLRVLLGQTPGPVAHVDQNALTPPPSNLPVGLPSQLLERRPDIQAAEQQLVAANAQIGVARAQFFPQLTISASGGIGGDSLGNLFDPAGRTVYGLGQLAQPIFAGGRLKGQLQLAEQAKKRLVLNYQNTILGAFRDVSNALIAYQKQRSVREEQEKLVAAAQDATRLARLRYQGGATGYLEVLTTDSALFSVQLNLVTAQQSEALTLVQLYSALGGGWKE
jgi:outer membrane protein, multidrug efflux system